MSHVCRMAYLLTLLLGATLLAGGAWKPPAVARFTGLTGQDVPRVVGGLSGRDYQLDPAARATVASGSVLCRTYGEGREAVDFTLIGGKDRQALHDPRTCLTGGGWMLVNDHAEHLPGTDVNAQSCQAVGRADAPGYDILYLYVVDGKRISQIQQIRTQMLWGALIGREEVPVYFLRFMQPLDQDPAATAAHHQRLLQFAARMWQSVQPQIMKADTSKGGR